MSLSDIDEIIRIGNSEPILSIEWYQGADLDTRHVTPRMLLPISPGVLTDGTLLARDGTSGSAEQARAPALPGLFFTMPRTPASDSPEGILARAVGTAARQAGGNDRGFTVLTVRRPGQESDNHYWQARILAPGTIRAARIALHSMDARRAEPPRFFRDGDGRQLGYSAKEVEKRIRFSASIGPRTMERLITEASWWLGGVALGAVIETDELAAVGIVTAADTVVRLGGTGVRLPTKSDLVLLLDQLSSDWAKPYALPAIARLRTHLQEREDEFRTKARAWTSPPGGRGPAADP